MVDFNDKSQKTIGSIAIRWFFSFFYVLAAISAMVFLNLFIPIDTNSQFIIHAILLFLLVLGLYFASSSAQNVQGVSIAENQMRDHLEEMRSITKEVSVKLTKLSNIPADISTRISSLHDDLRFVSPCNNQNAIAMELDFVNEMKLVENCLTNLPLNFDTIAEHIHCCELSYKERKQIFSN